MVRQRSDGRNRGGAREIDVNSAAGGGGPWNLEGKPTQPLPFPRIIKATDVFLPGPGEWVDAQPNSSNLLRGLREIQPKISFELKATAPNSSP